MTKTSSPRARIRRRAMPAVAVAALLVLTGCVSASDGGPMDGNEKQQTPTGSDQSGTGGSAGGEAANDTGQSPPGPGEHRVILTMTGQSITFTPTTCVSTTDGFTIHGPGVDLADKSRSFLDMNIGRVDGWFDGNVRVYFNAERSAPTDVYFEGTIGGDDDYSISEAINGFEVDVEFWNHDRVPIGPGSFQINCA